MILLRNGTHMDEFRPVPFSIKDDLKKKHGINFPKVVIYVGRLVENKGVHNLINAVNLIEDKKLCLLIVGGNTFNNNEMTEYMKSLRELAAPSGERIKFLGYTPHDQLPEFYQLSDIYLIPSEVKEALPTSMVEAMACGIAAIGSRRGGIVDLIEEGSNGYLIEDYANAEEWKEKIENLLGDGAQRRKFGENSRQKALDFSWENIARETNCVYLKILEERP